jgi:hypothetical protein
MEPPRFPFADCGRQTAAQGAKRKRFHNETDASEMTDFLVALAPVFARIFFGSHVPANRWVDAKKSASRIFF